MLSCSSKEQLDTDVNHFIVENKEYYFHAISRMNRMVIHTSENGEIIDTNWIIQKDFTYKLYFNKDTILNDTNYKLVWYENLSEKYRIGAIRETSEGKIYYRKNPFQPEFLLYDFNLHENDKFSNLLVKSCETIVNCNIPRKQLLLTQCCGRDTLYWIQGIGNTRDILNNTFSKMCYCFDNGDTIISNSSDESENFIELLFVKVPESIIYIKNGYNVEEFEFTEKIEYF
jgi:hypothetical protein